MLINSLSVDVLIEVNHSLGRSCTSSIYTQTDVLEVDQHGNYEQNDFLHRPHRRPARCGKRRTCGVRNVPSRGCSELLSSCSCHDGCCSCDIWTMLCCSTNCVCHNHHHPRAIVFNLLATLFNPLAGPCRRMRFTGCMTCRESRGPQQYLRGTAVVVRHAQTALPLIGARELTFAGELAVKSYPLPEYLPKRCLRSTIASRNRVV